jgi:hypothetical protein
MRTEYGAHAVSVAGQATLCGIAFLTISLFPAATNAQDSPARQPDPACMKQCVALGFDDGYCDRACKFPAAQPLPPNQSINWNCATECRASGGNMGDCVQACKRN